MSFMGSEIPRRSPRLRTRTARVLTREMVGASQPTGTASTDSLVVIYGPKPADITRRYVLDRTRPAYEVGRSGHTDIVVDSTCASRHHARFERDERGWAVRDLGSTNGTWVNDARVSDRHILAHGDRVQVGEVIFKHLSGDDVEAAFAEAIRVALITDGLTQASNERAFRDALNDAVRRGHAQGIPVSLVMVDIDHFKAVNDTHGHSAGDRVLREFVRVIRGECDARVHVARVGGEEFALMLPGATAAEAMALAERARAAVEAHAFGAPSGTLRITASFGVAQLGAGREDGTALFAHADAMLYEAKRGGRNRVCG